MAGNGHLTGLRVLVVEDEMLVSLLIEDALTDQECVIVGPYNRVSAALQAAQAVEFDAAVMDINIAGTRIYPVAEILSSRGIPFVLLSGYGADALPTKHAAWPVCAKPFRSEQLIAMLEAQVAASHPTRKLG